ncbi:MAG: hypothetical protein JXR60_09185 [Bacteroidales bacterium]|nr:hypothetical protein [Bacteroidales bacterium]
MKKIYLLILMLIITFTSTFATYYWQISSITSISGVGMCTMSYTSED